MIDATGLLLGALGLAIGGFLKGAVGAGAPLIAVPILALLYDVPFAVAIFALPSLLSNVWQGWAYRNERTSPQLVRAFAAGGALGVAVGSLFLAWLPGDMLMAALSMIVFVYVGARVLKPRWSLDRETGKRAAFPVGALGGLMQGAGGISAPVSITFLNAMKLSRGEFISTISVFFGALALVQVPMLLGLGILTFERAGLSVLACLPLFGAIPLGAWAGRHLSKKVFDQLILILLVAIAVRLLWAAFS